MRVIAVIVGGLLLMSGGALIAVADQQRVAALEAAKAAVAQTRQDLEDLEDSNDELADTLAALQTQISEQEKQLADETGLLK